MLELAAAADCLNSVTIATVLTSGKALFVGVSTYIRYEADA